MDAYGAFYVQTRSKGTLAGEWVDGCHNGVERMVKECDWPRLAERLVQDKANLQLVLQERTPRPTQDTPSLCTPAERLLYLLL